MRTKLIQMCVCNANLSSLKEIFATKMSYRMTILFLKSAQKQIISIHQ